MQPKSILIEAATTWRAWSSTTVVSAWVEMFLFVLFLFAFYHNNRLLLSGIIEEEIRAGVPSRYGLVDR